MLGDKEHHSVDFCHVLTLDVVATEMHSSDVLQGSLLPGAELTGSASCPRHVNSEAMLPLAAPLSD